MNNSGKTTRKSRFVNLCLVLALMAGLLGLVQPVQASVPLLADWWVTDGRVYTTLLSGSTLYVGGSFTYVGPPTGSFAALDASGAPDMGFPPVTGKILTIVPDGSGGWYLGGYFTSVGGHPRNNLAHLKPDKSLDFAWNPTCDSDVRALVVSGGIVYIGGGYTTVNGQPRKSLASVDARTGLLTSWDPKPNNSYNSGMIYTLAASEGKIYIGGDFTTISGKTGNGLAMLDTATGIVTSLWDLTTTNYVAGIAVSGNRVYVGARFYSGGKYTCKILAVDISTRSVVWSKDTNDQAETLAVSGGNLYLGGRFTSVDKLARKYIAAVNIDTGTLTDWNPDANNRVCALVMDGDKIYVGGMFTTMGGQNRNRIAALDASTGATTAWAPNANEFVLALAVSGSTIFAGGTFSSIGGQTRGRLAALDVNTGHYTGWNPIANDTVKTLAVSQDGKTIYAGGWFTTVGGLPRNRLAALDAITGSVTAWNPDANNYVYSLVTRENTVYAGGAFTAVGGQVRNRLAALDASTGSVIMAWNPNADQYVSALAVSGNTIYAGGYFDSVGGQTRGGLAALDASTGNATDWNPDRAPVLGFAVGTDRIYIAGNFSSVGGQEHAGVAALDINTGRVTSWNPNVVGYASVVALSEDGNTVYVGGDFGTIGGQTRNKLAALDASTGLATAWNPNYGDSIGPYYLTVREDNVYVGGELNLINGHIHRGLVVLRNTAATCQSAASGGSWRVSNWSNCGNAIPGDGDSVTLQAEHTLTLYGSLAANNLTTNPNGELNLPLGSTLTLEGTLTNNGRLTQTRSIPSATAITFLNLKNAAGTTNKYFGLTLTPAGGMGNTTVTIKGNQNCTTNPASALIKRCFDISPTTPQNATARFYYTNAELNGQIFNQLKLWHWNVGWSPSGNTYSRSTTCDAGQQDCWMEAKNVSSYSPFVLGSGNIPTAVKLQSFAARSNSPFDEITLVGLLLLGLSGIGLVRVRRR